jgi:NAD(P)-dependent dehydrogenase (short-subunit alcohol dehydrogenase family)
MGTRLGGKVALVTGAASGIGAATARLFAREGARAVVVADVSEAGGRAVAAEIEAAGGHAVFQRLDVTQEAEWVEVVRAVVQRYGRLHVLVNNAGRGGAIGRPALERTTEEAWDALFAVNAKGVFLGTKHVIPAMRDSGGGAIVNVVSIYGLVGSRYGTAYHASKGAARMLTRVSAVQYAPQGIRINGVYPGFVETPMTADLHAQPGVREERTAQTPLGRLAVPEDIAPGILYLASDEASFVTGAELVIDGGMTAQ